MQVRGTRNEGGPFLGFPLLVAAGEGEVGEDGQRNGSGREQVAQVLC